MGDETQSNQQDKKKTLWYKPSVLEEVRRWPKDVTEEIGRQLNKVEYGGQPTTPWCRSTNNFKDNERQDVRVFCRTSRELSSQVALRYLFRGTSGAS